jgi:hypothetical protein
LVALVKDAELRLWPLLEAGYADFVANEVHLVHYALSDEQGPVEYVTKQKIYRCYTIECIIKIPSNSHDCPKASFNQAVR